MKHCLTVKFCILLLVFNGGQALSASMPTRILEADFTAVHVQENAVLVADSEGNLLRSNDGGINLAISHHGDPEDAIHAIDGSDNTVIAVGGGGWILRSADDGLTWARASAEPMLGSLNTVASNGNGRWVAGGTNLASAAIQVSVDDGKTWTLHAINGIDDFLLFTGITWHPVANQFIASGGDGLFNGSILTSPDGSSWTSVDLPPGTPFLHFVVSDRSNGLLAGGEQGTLLRSSGSSINFSAVEGFQPSETLRSAVSTAQGSWTIGGDQAIVVEVSAASAKARLLSTPLAAADPIISMANRGSEELLLVGSFANYPWGPPELQAHLSGDQLNLRVHNARLGRTYHLQSSSDLSQWTTISGTTRQATQRTEEWTVSAVSTRVFFRVLVE